MAFEAPEDAGDDIETLWELFVLTVRVRRVIRNVKYPERDILEMYIR